MLSPTSRNDPAQKIKILVCTANIGNEPPDQLSLNRWIPRDGDVKTVLEDQPYPIPFNSREKFKSAVKKIVSGGVQTLDDGDERNKFDIIAIGMQEATFQVETGEKPKIVKNVKKLTTQVNDLTSTNDYHKPKSSAAMVGIRKITSIVRGEKVKQTLSQSRVDSEVTGNSSHPSERKTTELSERGEDDTRILHQMLQEHLPSYTRVVSYQRGQMRLVIFYNELEISLEVLSVQAQNTGTAGLANKGGIVAECNINGGTRIAFMSAHLEAHEGDSKYKTRCSTMGDIFRGTRSSVPDFHCDASLASHFTFVMGDLNFRTRLPDFEPGSPEHIEEAHRLAERKAWSIFNEHDELSHAIRNNDCLAAFQTLKCNFPCTFKVHRMDGYRYNEKRSPSYTDRILYNANHLLWDKIKPLAYEPIDHFTSSDHKPIRGAFELELNSALRWRPILVKEYQSFRATGKWGRMLKGSSLGKVERPSPSQKENMHFFVSSIKCNIASTKSTNPEHLPRTYVSFVSTPSDIMKKDVTKKQKLFKFLGISERKVFDSDGSTTEMQMGWPRTKCSSKTRDPEWHDEVHFKVQTHYTNGTPMDLTGALLHVLLFDSKEADSLIGSCTLNLAFFISTSRAQMDKNHLQSRPTDDSFDRKSKLALFVVNKFRNLVANKVEEGKSETPLTVNVPQENPVSEKQERVKKTISSQLSEGESDVEASDFSPEAIFRGCSSNETGTASTLEVVENGPSNALRSVYRSSVFASTTRKVAQNALRKSVVAAPGRNSSLDDLDIHSLTIDEPLMKNGREVGRINFTLDTWWLDSKTTMDGQGLACRDTRNFSNRNETKKNTHKVKLESP
ncbi:hypothetical protein IV203_029841 [Nitzschia inconspicua]|uniref:Inositol polyphosphate-related phosphatase domain-containing protein n=1 Tax=Nitzschia inconspicua TaxID=303405 RepID=A0A9K3LV06_9STRA|nr:hypothetical protein IV203_029841 [Nitzschia inconspicua]